MSIKKNKSALRKISEAGNIFLMLFGAVAMVGVVGAATMTIMKGPVRTMSIVTKRTITENNMIATGKLAIIASAQGNSDCDGDGTVEPIPYDTAIGTTGGGTIPLNIGVARQDPWGQEYLYCGWNHGDNIDTTGSAVGCDATKLRTGNIGATDYVLAIISAGVDGVFQTACNDAAPFLDKPTTSDDIILGFTYNEATTIAAGLWNLQSGNPNVAEIVKDLEVKNTPSGPAQLAFDSALGNLSVLGSGRFPVVQTDNIQAIGGAGIGLASNLATGGSWLSGDGGNEGLQVDGAGDVTASGDLTITDTLTAGNLATTGTLDVTGISTLGVLNASGAVDFDSTLNVDGNTTLNGNLTVDTNTFFVDAAANRVFINTNNATSAFDVTGLTNSFLGRFISPNVSLQIYEDVDLLNWMGLRSVNGAGLLLTTQPDIANLSIATTTGNVGINTRAGTGKFNVNGIQDMMGFRIINLANPVNPQDAATMAYVLDRVANGTVTEVDPTITKPLGVTGKVCRANGTKIECLSDETDPKVGTIQNGRYCTSDGTVIECTTVLPTAATTARQLADLDGNTKIQVEESANDDTIRFDTAGIERMTIAPGNGVVSIFNPNSVGVNNYSELRLSDPTALNWAVGIFSRNNTATANQNDFYIWQYNNKAGTLIDRARMYIRDNGQTIINGDDVARISVSRDNSFTASNGYSQIDFGDYFYPGSWQVGSWSRDNTVVANQNDFYIYQGNDKNGTTVNAYRFFIDDSGDVAIGTNSPADGSGSGGQNLKLDVEGPMGATHYCDSAGLNCFTPASVSGGGTSIDSLSDAKTDYVTDNNMFLGSGSGAAITTGGQYNTVLGINAGAATTTGDENSAFGFEALADNNIGIFNSAFGSWALRRNTSGDNNTGIGTDALENNSNGSGNTSVGTLSMQANTTGYDNTAVGTNALFANVAKAQSTAIGFEAMRYADSTSTAGVTFNTAVGYRSLYGSTNAALNTGRFNTAVGHSSLLSNREGNENTAIGQFSLSNNFSGSFNTALGSVALTNNTTGVSNTALGHSTLTNNTIGVGNVAIGTNVLQNNVARNYSVAIGYEAMLNTTNTATAGDSFNTAIGYQALRSGPTVASNTGTGNTAIGYRAQYGMTSGLNNTALGYAAGFGNTTGSGNTVIGQSAFYTNTTGSGNIAMGTTALYENTVGVANLGIGTNALYTNKAKGQSTAVGVNAMRYADDTTTVAPTYNTALGYEALRGSLTPASNTGIANTAIGHSALLANTSGIWNTALGANAGDTNTTGGGNTFIGFNADADANNYTNGTALGSGAVLTASNRIVLGNTSIASIYAQVTSITGISDERKKKDVKETELGLDFINKLRPIQYRYNNGDDTLRFGFIAQETEKLLPKEMQALVGKQENGLALVNHDADGEQTYHMSYTELISPLVKSVQELKIENDALKMEVAALKTSQAEILKSIDAIGVKIGYYSDRKAPSYAGIIGAGSIGFILAFGLMILVTRKRIN